MYHQYVIIHQLSSTYHHQIHQHITNISIRICIYIYIIYIYIFNLSPNSNPYHAKNGTMIRAGRKNPSLPLHPFAVLRSAPCECCGALKGGALEGVGNNPVLRGLTTNHLLGWSCLVGSFKYFWIFTTKIGGKWSNLRSIFFKWVETTT